MRLRGGICIFAGNMPFLGGRRIATEHGEDYAQWLTEMYGGTGDTDYIGYFFHRASELMSDSGSIGFIATAAITDGDNRRTVLERLTRDEGAFEIYGATTGFPWPGNAQVNVSVVHLAKNLPPNAVRPKLLNGRAVEAINSRLRGGGEWLSPTPLPENAGCAFVGCFLRGEGFILEEEEGRAFLDQHPEEADVLRPFLVGDDLNNSVDQRAQRYVIDFRDMTLEEARVFPEALRIVEERVRPKREQLKTTGADADHRKFWWRFANVRRELRARAATMPRFLATARVSKRPVFAFVPSAWTPSEQVVVFALPTWTAFAVLQSRVHRAWVEFQASHMGEGLRYSATDCFAPFPLPKRDPKVTVPELEELGEQVHEARGEVARKRGIGLTETYNALEEPTEQSPDVVALRRMHEVLDRAVLDAYGWRDVSVPPYCLLRGTHAGENETFEDTTAERLFQLNAERTRSAALATEDQRPCVRRTEASAGPGPKKAAPRSAEPTKRMRAKRG